MPDDGQRLRHPRPLTPPAGQEPEGPLRIRRPGLELQHWSGWLASEERGPLLQHLRSAAIAWEQPWVLVYGRRHPVPRLVCWYGDPGCSYRYSGLSHDPLPWTPPLANLREQLSERLGWTFNSLLLNRYRTGADRMGWHADDEPELAEDHPIASLSLGVTRTLRFRPRPPRGRGVPSLASDQASLDLDLADGDLLLMEPPTQSHWQHGLPARRRQNGERLNLTFRRINA